MKVAISIKHRLIPSLKHLATIITSIVFFLSFVPSAKAFYVDKGKIHNDQSQIISIRGINWFGFETTNHVPHGLWTRNINRMITQMKSLNINAVRLPLAPNAIHGSQVNGINYSLNPELENMDSLEILDYVVNKLNKAGMYILLDHHRPDDNAISELWYTQNYSEQQWLDDLRFLANRYKNVSHFLGIDLKNEPHGAATWGSGNQATDWNLAAERASRVVLAANPKALIFVEGIASNAFCSSSYNANWGGNLAPIQCTPLDIPQNKLVLAPHAYGPDVYMQDYFKTTDFPNNMPDIWEQHFGFSTHLGYTVIPTEYGSTYGHHGLELEKVWFDAFIAWLKQKRITDTFFWSWNPNSGDTGGLLKDDWKTIWPDKLNKLNELWGLPSSSDDSDSSVTDDGSDSSAIDDDSDSSDNVTDISSGSTPSTVATLTPQFNKTSDWGQGYCMDVSVTNSTSQSVEWRTLIPKDGTISKIWNATVTASSPHQLAVKGVDWNASLKPEGSTLFGYCAERSSNDTNVTNNSLVTLQPNIITTSDWGSGYCKKIEVQNNSNNPIQWITTLNISGSITSSWNTVISNSDGNQVVAQGVSWNEILEPGTKASFGYCAKR